MSTTRHPGLHSELTDVVRKAVKAHLNSISDWNLVYHEGVDCENIESLSVAVGEHGADHFRIIVEYQDD